jgi:hypothetical protein
VTPVALVRPGPAVLLGTAVVAMLVLGGGDRSASAQPPLTPVFPTPPPTEPFPTLPPDVPTPGPHTPTPTRTPPVTPTVPTATLSPTVRPSDTPRPSPTGRATATDEPTPTRLAPTRFRAYVPFTVRNHVLVAHGPTVGAPGDATGGQWDGRAKASGGDAGPHGAGDVAQFRPSLHASDDR